MKLLKKLSKNLDNIMSEFILEILDVWLILSNDCGGEYCGYLKCF